MAIAKKAAATSPLNTFLYECTNTKGIKMKGEIISANIALAKAELRRQGLNPIKIRRKPKALFAFEFKQKVTPSDIAYISRQMATLIQAGVPLMQSLDIIAKGFDNPTARDLVLAVKGDVEAGRTFADSLKQHPLYFDNLFCSLVLAGEASGSLDTMLSRIATYKEKTETLKRKIKKALFYPCAIMAVAFIVTGILLIFVVPAFEKLFKGFGADLPLFTQAVLNLSRFVQKAWWLILAAFIGLLWLFRYFKRRSAKFQEFLDKMILKLPVVGGILHKAAIARFARTLATTFAAGVPLVEALDSVAGATGNIIYTRSVLAIREEVAMGSQMQVAMRNTGIFPNMVVQMVAIGEESGALENMLSKIASIYEEEVDLAVESLSTLLEPLIMVILGILVGSLVIAMYLPIFKMGSVF